MKKRYILLTVKIQNGEYQYYAQSLHILPKGKQILAYGEAYAKDFYGNFSWGDSNGYFFNGGEVATTLDNIKYITEAEYNVLSKFI